MNEFKKFPGIPNDITVTSQSELFWAIFNSYAENNNLLQL